MDSTTWNREDLTKGVEADECYYIQNEPAIRGRMKIDLGVDPPPDLAIEIDIASLSLSRLPLYSALGVPEVWRFDGQQLTFLKLAAGEYQEIEQSIALPLVKSGDILVARTKDSRDGRNKLGKTAAALGKEAACPSSSSSKCFERRRNCMKSSVRDWTLFLTMLSSTDWNREFCQQNLSH